MFKISEKRWVALGLLLSLLAGFFATRLVLMLPGVERIVADASTTRWDLVIGAIFATALAVLHGAWARRWGWTALFFGSSVALTWAAEWFSITSGWSGCYTYADFLGPAPGGVPLVVPFTWFMMIYPSYLLTNLMLTGRPFTRTLSTMEAIWYSLVTGLVMTAFDVCMDPFASGEKLRAWTWFTTHPEPDCSAYLGPPLGFEPGTYFGVPLLNFWHWVVVAFVASLIIRIGERWLSASVRTETTDLALVAVTAVYGIQAAVIAFVAHPVATRFPVPFTMGLPMILAFGGLAAWWRRHQEGEPDPLLGRLTPFPARDDGDEDDLGWSNSGRILVALLLVTTALCAIWQITPTVLDVDPHIVPLIVVFFLICTGVQAYRVGLPRTGVFLAISVLIPAGAELLGTHTGFPFGEFKYADGPLGPLLFGPPDGIPWVIPLAWSIFLASGHTLTNLIVDGQPYSNPRGVAAMAWLALISAALVTAFDLVLDPHCVHHMGAWSFSSGGTWFSVPLSNYLGWFGTAFLANFAYRLVEARVPARPFGRVPVILVAVPVLFYGWQAVAYALFSRAIPYGEHPGGVVALYVVGLVTLGIPTLVGITRLWLEAPRDQAWSRGLLPGLNARLWSGTRTGTRSPSGPSP
jgi:putative membrane protein